MRNTFPPQIAVYATLDKLRVVPSHGAGSMCHNTHGLILEPVCYIRPAFATPSGSELLLEQATEGNKR
jgi:hypothetical protein